MWMLQNKETGEITDPRADNFPLSPSDVVDGAEDWDTTLSTESEVDLIDGYARVWVE